jgi:hypothetical protein
MATEREHTNRWLLSVRQPIKVTAPLSVAGVGLAWGPKCALLEFER